MNSNERLGQNPIGEMFASVCNDFLEAHRGRKVTQSMIDCMCELVATTSCEFVGTKEAAEILGVTGQRVGELKPAIGSTAGEVAAGPFWLKQQIVEFGRTRNRRPGPRPSKG